MLAGDSALASEEITAEASAASLPTSRRTGADSCVRYLNARREYLRYGQALADGWPIATGVIEGACRHLIADWNGSRRTPWATRNSPPGTT